MTTTPSERRLSENEVVFRQLNQQVQKGIDDMNEMAREENQPEFVSTLTTDNIPLHFYCECSDENCTQRIKISPHEYNNIHKVSDHFTVVPGHQVPTIEHVVRYEKQFVVVEKHEMPDVKVAKLHKTSLDNVAKKDETTR